MNNKSKFEMDRNEVFEILKSISFLKENSSGLVEARKLVITLLENIENIDKDLQAPVKDSLASLGYFPYLANFTDNDLRASIGVEYHRSDSLKDIILHREQFQVSELINSGRSVILSAPTSFGKTLLVEELVARKKYKNIVIIEPTLALIDEIRNKMKAYEDFYKVVFSKNQTPAERNIFLLTQERLIEFPNLPSIDFFVIDEFYKLSFNSDERSDTLNHAFYLLMQKTKKFYLLGPPINSIPSGFMEAYNCDLLIKNFETVNITIKAVGKKSPANLYKLITEFEEPTMVYCKGPRSCETLAINFLLKNPSLIETNENNSMIEWINENIHEDWSLGNLLKHQVAFHHGGLPRHIGKNIVNGFNKGSIKYLFCTTTLIEGVNTSTKNVVVYDDKKGTKLLTMFDLRNISGRAGRMNQYLSGNVYMFVPMPSESSDVVDIPWHTQNEISDSLLVQIDEIDLKPDSKARIEDILKNPYIDAETIKNNSNVTPRGQISLAKKLRENPELHNSLSWTSYPNWTELLVSCELIWEYLLRRGEKQVMVDDLLSGKQLAYLTNRYRIKKLPRLLIADCLINDKKANVDKAVSSTMSLVRKWFEFRLPKMLMSLHNIQIKVYTEMGLKPGNYKLFAGELENGFLPPAISVLREMGVPAELGKKLVNIANVSPDVSVDELIKTIRSNLDYSHFTEYEKELLRNV